MSRRSNRRSSRRLHVENLESRVLLACEVVFDGPNDTLRITGDDGGNTVELVGTDDGIRVRCDGKEHGTFPLDNKTEDLAHIILEGKAGNDRVSLRFQDPVAELASISVNLGEGNDSLSLRFDDEVATELAFKADLSAGNDSFSVRFDDPVTAEANVRIHTHLGDGNDTASFRFRDPVSGPVEITTELGGGRNSFTFEAEEAWASAAPISVNSGDGNDAVTMRFRDDIHGALSVGATLGKGTNHFTFAADEDWHGDGKSASAMNVTGGEGADTVTLRFDEDVPAALAIDARLGNGTNHFTLEAEEGWRSAGESKINYVGGDGADFINLYFHDDIAAALAIGADLGKGTNSFVLNAHDGWNALVGPGSSLKVTGGDGRDHIIARLGQVRGNLDVNLEGGAEDDTVTATLTLPPPEAASPLAHDVDVTLTGGADRDLLTLLAFGDSKAEGLIIDGGADADVAFATENVDVQNTERINRVGARPLRGRRV
jgi:hypothetical protein